VSVEKKVAGIRKLGITAAKPKERGGRQISGELMIAKSMRGGTKKKELPLPGPHKNEARNRGENDPQRKKDRRCCQ